MIRNLSIVIDKYREQTGEYPVELVVSDKVMDYLLRELGFGHGNRVYVLGVPIRTARAASPRG